jgi:Fe-S-cluster containining protein
MRNDMKEKVDLDRCRKCGGQCCRIYSRLIGNMSEIAFSDWVMDWDMEFEDLHASRYAEPSFIPLMVHMNENQHLLGRLIAKGIDPYACQYLGPDGCRLPREHRPQRCREYMCEKMPQPPSVPADEIATIGAMCEAVA